MHVIAQSTLGVNWSHGENTDGWFSHQTCETGSSQQLVHVSLTHQTKQVYCVSVFGAQWFIYLIDQCAVSPFVHLRETVTKIKHKRGRGGTQVFEPSFLSTICSSDRRSSLVFKHATQQRLSWLVPQFHSWIKVNEPPQPYCCYYGLAAVLFGGCALHDCQTLPLPVPDTEACSYKRPFFHDTPSSGCGFKRIHRKSHLSRKNQN